MKTLKTRHQFYLPDDLSAKLEELGGKPGSSKSAILTEALRAWLDRKGVNELDERFGPRLDRQHRLMQRTETLLNVVAEMLNLFVTHQLTLVAHQPPFDAETSQLGLKRQRALIAQVGRRLAAGRGRSELVAIAEQEKQP